ncbi:MAG: lipopolysaccharide heptosyltransferase I [Sulfuritalea sp.]|nr:lipopolysaccharide heptosyltransferase I [Sulfuritalea sp.]
MRILLIKTSSLGDVVHNLPVVGDLRRSYPEAKIDWVVEEGFADIPRLHPGLRRVIPVALRRWRKAMFAPATWREVRSFRTALREENYDLAIDTQGLLKSALITRLAHGRRCGYTASSAREPLAARFYDARFEVAKNLHAVERNRRLAALAGGYTAVPAVDYGIAVSPASTPGGPHAVLLTATSRDDKLWPPERWIATGRALHENGLACLLPAGSTAERDRAAHIAQAIPGAVVLPSMGLKELAAQLGAARIVIGVDTGLVHLAAALGRPALALFCASDPALTGVLAATPAVNLGTRGRPPTVDDVLTTALPLL